jgi:hypothetical protein
MKTSRLVSFGMVLALAAMVGCGKKDKKSSTSSYPYYSNIGTPITDPTQLASTLTQLKADFANKQSNDGMQLLAGRQVYFLKRSVNTNEVFGIDWLKYNSIGQSCSGVNIMDQNGVFYATTSTTCNFTRMNWSSVPSTYNKANNSYMNEFANAAVATNITARQIYFNGAAYPAYEVAVPSFNPMHGKIYIVSPALPHIMNPLAVYDSLTGESEQVQSNLLQF